MNKTIKMCDSTTYSDQNIMDSSVVSCQPALHRWAADCGECTWHQDYSVDWYRHICHRTTLVWTSEFNLLSSCFSQKYQFTLGTICIEKHLLALVERGQFDSLMAAPIT